MQARSRERSRFIGDWVGMFNGYLILMVLTMPDIVPLAGLEVRVGQGPVSDLFSGKVPAKV